MNKHRLETSFATFAGGCFWCMQPEFDAIAGILSTRVGYTGGHTKNPSYEEICQGQSGHAEAILIEYDKDKVSFQQLLEIFWHNIDPTVLNRQFFDVGSQYRTAIFYHNEEQKLLAEESKKCLEATLFDKVYTEIVPASLFYAAEDYHQAYYKKNPVRYHQYHEGSRRQKRLQAIWGYDK